MRYRVHMCIKVEIAEDEKLGLLNRLLTAMRILENGCTYVKTNHKKKLSLIEQNKNKL